jgi:HK97 gp10 family phage protein
MAKFHVVGAGVEYETVDDDEPRRIVNPEVRRVASEVARDARSMTPRRTGTLRDGWRVAQRGKFGWSVVNDTPYARFVEYGTRHMRGQAMLGRALERARSRYV